ncbi:hypothetical protein chiPu_0015866 [Chiloscyllium punctatum]|uniref:Uncharacterized protein n=1 Tax=Chiloscyllium punctatum TaxID=137246 RepID=A0A401T3Z8_CHIPU|nr:hypothetical protein [Chiloscyllium punctatum]
MDNPKHQSRGTRAALLMMLMVLVESSQISQDEGTILLGGEDSDMTELSRGLVMTLLRRSLEMAARKERSLKLATRNMRSPEWRELEPRHKLSQLAEWERAPGRSDRRKSYTANKISSLQSSKRACFWKYCV